MPRKYNTKHNRGKSNFGRKVAEGQAGFRMSDPKLSDNKPASASR